MAVYFDKSLTFGQRLNEYNKESLMGLAKELGLSKLSKLRKAELVEKITERFFSPEVFFYRTAILSDKEISSISFHRIICGVRGSKISFWI